MARIHDFIKDIIDPKEIWWLVIRIIDVWSIVNNKGIEYLKMVIMDAKVLNVLRILFFKTYDNVMFK